MKNILVVDDDKVFLMLMRRMLKKEGHQVKTAVDGLESLDVLKTFTPDVVFVDLVMPNIDGRTLCRVIRSMEKFTNTPIVLLSATSSEDFMDLSSLGANACIVKGIFTETAKNVLSVLNQSNLAFCRCRPEDVVGINKVYPRRITKELLAIKRHFEIMFDKMLDAILEINVDGRIVYANSAAFSMADIPAKKLLGLNFVDLFSGDDRQRISDLMKITGSKLKTITADAPVRLGRYQITVNIIPLNNQNDSTLIIILHDVTSLKQAEMGLRTVNNDLEKRVEERTSELLKVNKQLDMEIAERKRAEKKIRASREYTQSIINSSLDMIISVDNERRIVEFNRAAENTFGYCKKEVLGEKVDLLYADPKEGDRVSKMVRENGQFMGEITNVRKNGRVFRCLISATLLKDVDDNIIGNMGISRDIEEK